MASIMLVAFALRAVIPPGFMPAGDRPFSIEICSEGFPAKMLAHGEPAHAGSMDMGSMGMGMGMDMDSTSHRGPLPGAHHHHSGNPSHSEHCVFGTASSAGPISHLPLLSDISCIRQLRAVALVSIAGSVHLVHLPEPRAPPGRLS
ncbi:MAG: hypothetical protein ACLPTM_03580 [Steroidobacteraceae bacterium]